MMIECLLLTILLSAGWSETTFSRSRPSVGRSLVLPWDSPSSRWGTGSTHQDKQGSFLRTSTVFVWFLSSSYVGYPGKLFLNMLKCLIIPLVVPSLIASIGSLDFRMSGKVNMICQTAISCQINQNFSSYHTFHAWIARDAFCCGFATSSKHK